MSTDHHPAPTPRRIAELRDALAAPTDASPETDYRAYADQIADLYDAVVAVRKEGVGALYDEVVPLLDHPDEGIRWQALSTLGHLSQSDSGRRARLVTRAAAMWPSDPDSLVRAVALRIWSQPYRNTADTDVLHRLAAVLHDEGEDVFVRETANVAILETSGALDRIRTVDPERARALQMSSEMAEPNVDWLLTESVLREVGITGAR